MLKLNSHSYKCYLRACIQFDNALFHIFAGPLFANVQGYAYLDLLVWGLSPITFLLLRDKFVTLFRDRNRGVRDRTFKWIIGFSCILFISYLFLNYSPTFNWNYFSRTFNIQVGYFIFDMLIRTFQLLVEVEQQKQPDKQCQTYCFLQHSSKIFAYLLVFYLSSIFQTNQRYSGALIFALCCIFSAISVILLPILYYFHHRKQINQYKDIVYQDQFDLEPEITHKSKNPINFLHQTNSPIKILTAMSLLTSSLVINTNYFSLWMMQPLTMTTQFSYQQYNLTINNVSGCFLFSTIGYYLAYRLFSSFKVAPLISKIILIGYGIALCLFYWNYHVGYVSALMLGFGFHQITIMQFAHLFKPKWTIDLQFYLKNEVFAYFILPIIFMILNIGQTSLKVYSLASGLMLILGIILL